MIVIGVIGAPARHVVDAEAIARRAAGSGSRVEIVGVVPADLAGDARLVGLAGADVGHATVIRSDAQGIEPADLDLALHYLPDIRAIVLVRPEASLLPVAGAAASWSGAGLIIVGPIGAEPVGDPTGEAIGDASDTGAAIVLDPPKSDPDGTFAGFVAALAGRFEAGEEPGEAWQSTLTGLAVDRVGGSS